MSAVATAFERAAAEDRAALVGYVPAGFPSVDGAIEAAIAMAEAGADVLEIGLPYSDPLIDGPVIQEAVHRALTGGTLVADVLRTVAALAAAGVPTLVMTYWNPVDHYGVDAFARDLAAAGGSGMITPDLTPEEAGPWLDAAATYRLDPVFLVAPSSTPERIKLVTSVCGGFVYAASLMGITGCHRRQLFGNREREPEAHLHAPFFRQHARRSCGGRRSKTASHPAHRALDESATSD